MAEGSSGGSGAVVACVALSGVTLFFWAIMLATLSDLNGSDAAGNGLAQAFAAGEIILVWLLLLGLMIVAAVKGVVPAPAGLAALILVPGSGIAALAALDLLADPQTTPFLWPMVVPALAPPLIILFCFWAVLPRLRAAIPAEVAAGFVWGAVAILCVSLGPMQHLRSAARERAALAAAKIEAAFAALPPDAPLWEWTAFLGTQNDVREEAVLAAITHLGRRQGDAETMFQRGDFPLRYLSSFDLDPTPSLCEKAHGMLRRRAAALLPKTAGSPADVAVIQEVEDATSAMQWLVGLGCSSDAEATAWEGMVRRYRDTDEEAEELADLRKPELLGKALREDPPKFSLLTPQAHLKAWLKFADDQATRDQALAGARSLDHRTADAVEMLKGDEFAAYTVVKYLPDLDLETTPALCDAAGTVLHGDLAQVYRPQPDDPRSYQELVERAGEGDQFAAVIWLARHGCDAEAELTDIESLIHAYQPSAESAEMLATLAPLQRKK